MAKTPFSASAAPNPLMETLQRAAMLHQRGDLEEARRLYKVVLRGAPDNFDALHFLGVLEAQRGRADKADGLIRKALRSNPRSAEAWSNLGNIQRDAGRPKEALASYDKALELKPDYANALNNQGIALLAVEDFARAVASFDRALTLEPRFAGAHYNRGIALKRAGRPADALAGFDQAIAVDPLAAEIHVERGGALMELGRPDEALAAFDRALALAPGLAPAHYNRAVAHLQLARFAEALAGFDQTLAIDPRHVGALGNRGSVLFELGRFQDAVASFDDALAIRRDNAEVLNNRGAALAALGRFDEALASHDKALAVTPDRPDALYKRGVLLEKLDRIEEAIAAYRSVLAIDPDYGYAAGRLVHTQMHACEWSGLDAEIAHLRARVVAGSYVADPWTLLSTPADEAEQLACARIFTRDRYPAAEPPLWDGARSQRDRIRLAYVCGEFREHATARLAAGLFELHDRTRFETFAISTGTNDRSAIRQRIEASFDVFVDAAAKSDREIAEMLRRFEIDIAVNLNGYSGIERTGAFALRPCPIQVSYLAFPGTMGADYIDYIIADTTVIPPDRQRFYAENVVYLPDAYQVNDARRVIAEATPTRAQLGLPEAAFVFCCFNSNHKITAATFDLWSRLLHGIDGSVLWLLESQPAARRNLLHEASRRGLAPERVVFAPRASLAEHLARHRAADLFLDTLPYNAHTTASDALWAGLPVLTCRGQTFAGRVAASLLTAVGLPELITDSLDHYEALAVKLAGDPAGLADLRARLARNRSTSALFDTDRFRRHIEAAYAIMWERHQRGEAPASFPVPPRDG